MREVFFPDPVAVPDPPIGLFDLTPDQFYLQDCRLALRADVEMVWPKHGVVPDMEPPTEIAPVDNDDIWQAIDASADRHFVRRRPGGTPTWETTPVEYTQAIRFNNTAFEMRDYEYVFGWMKDLDNYSYTIIWRGAVRVDWAVNTGYLWSTQSGTQPGVGLYYSSAQDGLRYLVGDGTTNQNFGYTWGAYTLGTVFTLAIRHTAGGITEMFVDNLVTPVASTTLTNGTPPATPPPAFEPTIGARQNGSQFAQMDMLGFVICAQKLSTADMTAWESWITQPQ